MNHLPVYDREIPGYCLPSPGDTADPNAPIDCNLCKERLARKEQEQKAEHFAAAMRLEEVCR